MKQTLKSVCSIALATLLVSCGIITPVPTIITTLTPVPSLKVVVSTPTIRPVMSTPTYNSKTFIITPDVLFSIPRLKTLNTPDITNFCEHLPLPQIDMDANEFSLLVGRFSLCVSHSWPWVKTAMDLDAGTFVSLDDKSGDIAMDYTHPDLNGDASYFVHALNNAHIDDIDSASLTYRGCEKLVIDLKDSGSFSVHEGKIACVMTTGGKMALIRVEDIYPLNTQGVEFTFAILKQ